MGEIELGMERLWGKHRDEHEHREKNRNQGNQYFINKKTVFFSLQISFYRLRRGGVRMRSRVDLNSTYERLYYSLNLFSYVDSVAINCGSRDLVDD